VVLVLSLYDYVRRVICMFHMAVGNAAGLIFINKAFIYFSIMNNKRFSWSTLPPCNYYMTLHYCILHCVDHQLLSAYLHHIVSTQFSCSALHLLTVNNILSAQYTIFSTNVKTVVLGLQTH